MAAKTREAALGLVSQALVIGLVGVFFATALVAMFMTSRLELAWLRPESLWGVIPRFAGPWLPPFRGSAPFHWHSLEQVRAISLDGPVYLDLDGQPTGRLPAAFSVVRRALPVMVAPVAVKLKKPRFAPVNKLGNRRLVGNIKSAAGM